MSADEERVRALSRRVRAHVYRRDPWPAPNPDPWNRRTKLTVIALWVIAAALLITTI